VPTRRIIRERLVSNWIWFLPGVKKCVVSTHLVIAVMQQYILLTMLIDQGLSPKIFDKPSPDNWLDVNHLAVTMVLMHLEKTNE
jgi:hypothetical protein